MAGEDRRFSEAEVEAILRRAVARQEHGGTLSRDELADVLKQMNLDAGVLDEAIADEDEEAAIASEIAAWKDRRRKAFRAHAISAASVLTMLLAINLLTFHGYLWVVWPLLGWSIGLFSHYRRYLEGPDENALASVRARRERQLAREQRRADRETRKQRRKDADAAMARARDDLADAVKTGVANILQTAGRTLREATADTPVPGERRTGVRVEARRDEPVRDEDVAADLADLRDRVARKRGDRS